MAFRVATISDLNLEGLAVGAEYARWALRQYARCPVCGQADALAQYRPRRGGPSALLNSRGFTVAGLCFGHGSYERDVEFALLAPEESRP